MDFTDRVISLVTVAISLLLRERLREREIKRERFLIIEIQSWIILDKQKFRSLREREKKNTFFFY